MRPTIELSIRSSMQSSREISLVNISRKKCFRGLALANCGGEGGFGINQFMFLFQGYANGTNGFACMASSPSSKFGSARLRPPFVGQYSFSTLLQRLHVPRAKDRRQSK